MDTFTAIVFVVVLTALFVVGGKIAFYFKNREIQMLREHFNKELESLRQRYDSKETEINTNWYKNLKQIEASFQAQIEEKNRQIEQLSYEIEQMKAWKNDLFLKIAESSGDSQNILFKLINLTIKLEQQRNANWLKIEERLTRELENTVSKIKELFKDNLAIQSTGLEIINLYESKLPDEWRKKIQQEFLSQTSKKDFLSLPQK